MSDVDILKCDSCGSDIASVDKFCGECGAPQPDEASAAESSLQPDLIPETATSPSPSSSSTKAPFFNKPGVIIAALALLVGGMFFLNNENEGAQQNNLDVSLQSEVVQPQPSQSVPFGAPKVTLIEVDSGIQLCGPTGDCEVAGEMDVGDVITTAFSSSSNMKTAVTDIDFNDGSNFTFAFAADTAGGQLIRIPAPVQGDEDTVAFEMIQGVLSVDIKDKTLIINMVGGTCYFASGKILAEASSDQAKVSVRNGAGRCEDAKGALHYISTEGTKTLNWWN